MHHLFRTLLTLHLLTSIASAQEKSSAEANQVKAYCADLTAVIADPNFKAKPPAAKQTAIAQASDRTLKSKDLKKRIVTAGKQDPSAIKQALYAIVKDSWRCPAFDLVYPD
ncbi:MAG: hypothetical protein NT027_20610 [Proteobacteria bacterium]|nr:hypothetical protein [Pseudomonadota bacterium]